MSASLRALMRGLFDYAGLFPPAGLGMADAVANYSTYRTGRYAWMLGRFVLPAARLAEFETAVGAVREDGAATWKLAVLLSDDAAGDYAALQAFNRRARQAVADTVEGRATDVNGVSRLAGSRPPGLVLYVELPPGDYSPSLEVVAARDARAKIRAGGTTAEAFPSAGALLDFMSSCIEAKVAWKATAGLHHAIGASYRLSYEPGAASAPMFGFLNLAMAAALLHAGTERTVAQGALLERDASCFSFDKHGAAWQNNRISVAQLEAAHTHGLVAIGSCSFDEPTAELATLGLVS